MLYYNALEGKMDDRFFPNAQFLWRFGHNNLPHLRALKITRQVATR